MAQTKDEAAKTADQTEAERKAADEAAEAARKAAETAGAEATDAARKQSIETLKAQEDARPYPSQEEADRIKTAAPHGAAPYSTRQLKS